MSATRALITNLRKEGVRLYREGTRLIVEAPPGVITPEIRAELLRSKQELLTALGEESPGAMGEDPIAAEALCAIARLLAAAYRRQQDIRRVSEDHADRERHGKLALRGEPSVHGVVP